MISELSCLPRKEEEDRESHSSSVVGMNHTEECIDNNEQVFVDTPRMGHPLETPTHVLAPWPPAHIMLPGPEPDVEDGQEHAHHSPVPPAYDDPSDLAARPAFLTGNSMVKPAEHGGGFDRRTQCYRIAGILVFLLAVATIIILIATSTGRFTGRR